MMPVYAVMMVVRVETAWAGKLIVSRKKVMQAREDGDDEWLFSYCWRATFVRQQLLP